MNEYPGVGFDPETEAGKTPGLGYSPDALDHTAAIVNQLVAEGKILPEEAGRLQSSLLRWDRKSYSSTQGD